MDRIAYSLLPLSGGFLVSIRAPVNARLRTIVDSPAVAGLVAFAIGTMLLFLVVLARGQIGAVSKLGGGPWWVYLGGVCGTTLASC